MFEKEYVTPAFFKTCIKKVLEIVALVVSLSVSFQNLSLIRCQHERHSILYDAYLS